MTEVADKLMALRPSQQDLSGPAVVDMRGALQLDQTPREGLGPHWLGPFEVPSQDETKIEGLFVLNKAGHPGLGQITAAAKVDETGVTLNPPSLRGYLPVRTMPREVRRTAAAFAADTRGIFWEVFAAATSSALLELLPALRARRPAAGVVWRAASTEQDTPLATDRPAYQAFKELARWLEADEQDVANAIGIGRTTPSSWKRDGREPRADTVRRLYEYHSTLDALRRRLGQEGLRAWIFARQGMHRAMLLSGDLAAVEGDVNAVLFGDAAERLPDLAWAPDEQTEPEPAAHHEEDVPLTGRRPRRTRLP